ncbi:unnamed protein product, partial [Sphacelaria rigidula]
MGKDGVAAYHNEVEVSWLSPSNRRMRENASRSTTFQYGKGVFDMDFRERLVSGTKKRQKLVPDVDWMACEDVVASCASLRAGKYIPNSIITHMPSGKSTGSRMKKTKSGTTVER